MKSFYKIFIEINKQTCKHISDYKCRYFNKRKSKIVGIFQTAVYEIEYKDICLLYTSDAADDRISVDLGGRRII